jgi:hypothetical protein
MNIHRMTVPIALVASCLLGAVACATPNVAPTVASDATAVVAVDVTPLEDVGTSYGALSFTLDETSRDDVMAWAADHGVACEQRSAGRWMHCVDVPGDAVGQADAPTIDDLELRFDGSGKLWNVQATRKNALPASASRYFASVTRSLEESVGMPSESVGDASPAPRQRSARAYRAAGLEAKVVASNFGPGGVLLLESSSSRS